MRVAIIKSNGHIDKKVERLLNYNKIKGDFISKFTRNSLKMYDVVIFTYKNSIPNLPKVIESIVFERKILVIYINNTLSTSEFYNILNNLYFSVISEHTLEIELFSILNNSLKYLKEIEFYKNENNQIKEQFETLNIVNKAKRVLIKKGFTEAESHKFIQEKAMNLRISKIQTAKRIIENKIDI